MLTLLGAPALSVFRKQKLLSSLQALDASVLSVSAHYVHFVALNDGQSELDAQQQDVLSQLLKYGPTIHEDEAQAARGAKTKQTYLVVPRPGTISPWSSKAT